MICEGCTYLERDENYRPVQCNNRDIPKERFKKCISGPAVCPGFKEWQVLTESGYGSHQLCKDAFDRVYKNLNELACKAMSEGKEEVANAYIHAMKYIGINVSDVPYSTKEELMAMNK